MSLAEGSVRAQHFDCSEGGSKRGAISCTFEYVRHMLVDTLHRCRSMFVLIHITSASYTRHI